MAYISGYSFHFWQHLRRKVVGSVIDKILFHIAIRKFVTGLMLSIVFHVLLNGVICQVNAFGYFIYSKFIRSCSDVAFLVPVKFQASSDLYT